MGIKWDDVLKAFGPERTTVHLARVDLPYPQGALDVTRYEDGTTTMYPVGGGFGVKPSVLESHEFRLATDEETRMDPSAVPWRRGWFGIDNGPLFGGWTQGDSWNGWACPYFEFDEAKRAAAHFKDDDGKPGTYDQDGNAFVWADFNGEEYRVTGEIVETPDGRKAMYGIGASYWTWDEETCPGCATPGVRPHDADCWRLRDRDEETVTLARLKDIKGLWDMWGFGDKEEVSEPTYKWLKEEIERRTGL